MTPVERLAAAETNATLARARLNDTIAALQTRVEPKRLARDARLQLTAAGSTAVERITDVGGTAAMRSADSARENPGAIGAIIGAILLFVARHRIAKLFRRNRAPKLTPKPGQDFR